MKIEGEWRALLVTEDMAGFISIADWYARHAVSPYSDEVRQAMLKAVALAFKKCIALIVSMAVVMFAISM